MRYLLATLGVAVLLFAGCQSDPFVDVSGTVTLDGQPLQEGEIIFLAPDSSTTPSSGTIKDGQYKCRASRGMKKVQINSVRDTGRKEMDGWPIRESIIPQRYNTKTELTADVGA